MIGKSGIAALAAMVALLGACTPHTSIATNKDQGYTREPQRLLVIEAMGRTLGTDNQTFQATLSQDIKACHIFSNYVITPPELSSPNLSFDDKAVQEWKAKRDVFIRRAHPDTVLGIAETQHTVTTLYRNGMEMSRSIPQIVYELSLTDIPTHKTVWKAQVTLYTGMTHMTADPGTQLANDIVAKLRTDGIFQHCAASGATPTTPPSPYSLGPELRIVSAIETRNRTQLGQAVP